LKREKLFDESLGDERNDIPEDSGNMINEPQTASRPEDASDAFETETPEKPDAAGPENANDVPDEPEGDNRKLFIIRIAAVAVAVLGVVMLVSGMVLQRLDEESRKTPEKAQMPEEYIEEFFSDENFTPNIENYLEPEA
jgi:hypothetical protein